MGAYIKSEGKGIDDLKKGLEFLKHHKLLIGIPEKEAFHAENGGHEISNVALAFIHTNGSPKRGIPPRPFLEPGLVSTGAVDRISDLMREAARDALNGQEGAALAKLNAAGLEGQGSVQDYIGEGIAPPNAPSTVRAKAKKGSTSPVPLIDTTSMQKSITYVIEEV